MEATIQLKRGLDADLGTVSPADGEPLWTTDTHYLYIGQGGVAYPVSSPSPLTTKGDVWTFSTVDARLPVGTNGQVLSADSTTATGLKWIAAGGTGTVTSVDLTMPGGFLVAGNPITTSGTLAVSFGSAPAHSFLAGPSGGGPGAITWRLMVESDLPAHTGPSALGWYSNVSATPAAIDGTADQVLRVNSAGDTLAFGQVKLDASAAVTGTLDETNGGTGLASYTLGDVLYASASNTLSRLAGNTTSTKKFLRQTGTGTVSAAPAWDTIVSGDLPTVPETKGGTNQTTYTTGDLLYASASNTLAKRAIGTTGQFLWVTGGLPAWHTPDQKDITGFGCYLSNTTSQAITSSSTWTSVTWDTEGFDDGGFHSTSSNTSRVTIPTGYDGLYLLSYTFEWGSNATGTRHGRILKNGTTAYGLAGGWPTAAGLNPCVCMSVVLRLVATDYVEVQAWQSSGGSLSLNVTTAASFSVAYLGK